MGLIEIITLIGGVAFFLYGMHVMSSGLAKLSGGKLEATLRKMTSSLFKSILLGAGITVAIQSSSATTVMLVGLVNSGIMRLEQTVGVIIGSNVGKTATAWLLSLTGIKSENVFISLLKPENFSLILAVVGIIFIMGKNKRRKDLGTILLGFAVLMSGMRLMSGSVSGLASSDAFTEMLTMFKNPLLGVLVGAAFTGVIQSSAASVGILQALSLTGDITFEMAIPLIMGLNIGTCITAVISSIGVNRDAKRVAAVHVLFNVIGTAVVLAAFYALHAVIDFSFLNKEIDPFGIAFCHTAFNIVTMLLLMPFAKQLVKLSRIIIKGKKGGEEASEAIMLDERLLQTPAVAVAECRNYTVKMAKLAKETIFDAIDTLSEYSKDKAESIEERESEIDGYEDKLGTYLVKMSSSGLTQRDSHSVSKMLHSISDFERISDHAVNILRTAREIYEKQVSFSAEAKKELWVLIAALKEILNITVTAFSEDDLELAQKVEPLEQVIDNLTDEIKSRHIERLRAGNCTIEMGFILTDLTTDFERVSDHCSNIAVALIEVEEDVFNTHTYLNAVKTGNDEKFKNYYDAFSEEYKLAE
ncbi:MAG: Na/Pi cotransporter family protein [Clostridia bacterium]|nr:Na/Pi cotransporter family protein [Clostridia bacterium]